MKITNLSRGVTLAEHAVIADSFFKRLIGLLGKKKFGESEALVIKPCNSIHTFFMRFPIDVLLVDKNNSVLKAIAGLKPFRITGIYFDAAYAVELPQGMIKFSSTSIGDTLSIT